MDFSALAVHCIRLRESLPKGPISWCREFLKSAAVKHFVSQMRDIIPDEKRPTALKTGNVRDNLRELCPEECGALALRYRCWRHEASELRKRNLFEEVRQLVRQIRDEGKHPTVGRVASLLSDAALREW